MTERSETITYAVLLAILAVVLCWSVGSTVLTLFHL
jgi:hypothetical protein